jgi:hypothetical protein
MADERQGDFLIALAPDDDRPRHGTFLDVLFSLAVWLTCMVSGWATYIGFSVDLPKLVALVLAVAIALFLTGLNFELRKRKRAAQGLWGTLVMLAFVVIISFLANTNAVYSYQVRRDIVGQTQEAAWRVFDAETGKISRAISEVPAVAALEDKRRRLDVARQNLKTQIVDQRNPGFGTLAQEHYAEVIKILGINLTPLRAPDPTAPAAELASYANRLDAFIEEQAQTQFKNDPAAPYVDLRANIDKVKAFYAGKMREKAYSSDTTDLMTRDLDGYAASASELLPGKLTIATINNTADEIGSIQYTWRNFLNWISPTAIVISIIVAFILDGVVPLFTLLVVRPDNWY